METRHYKTSFVLSKIAEFLGWLVIIIGFISGVSQWGTLGGGVAISIIAVAGVAGLLLVFLSQLTLIFIDTENNTRQLVSEILKTNAMLAETLGTIAANLSRLANKGDLKQ